MKKLDSGVAVAEQERKRQQVPTKGLWTSAVADAIGPEYSPWCQNVRFRYGKILRTPGRSVTLDINQSNKAFMDFAIQTDVTGVQTIVGINSGGATDAEISTFDPSSNRFSDHQSLNLTARQDLRFSWTQGEEQLMIVRASEISAVNVDPTTGIATINKLAPPFAGSTAPSDFNSNPNAIYSGQTPVACFIEYFKNHVFLGNILASAIDPNLHRPSPGANRLMWSAEGNYKDWDTTTAWGSAHGGFLEIYDGAVEPVTGIKVLNDRLVVYRNSSIIDMNATGDAFNPFLPENRVFGIGCMLPWSLVSLGQFHIFVGNDFNVYAWDGTNLDPIGTPIHSYIRQLFDPAQQAAGWRMIPFAAVFMGFKEYWLVVPQADGTSAVLIYDYLRQAWTRDTFNGEITALFEQTLPGAVGTSGFTPGHPADYPTLMVGSNTDFFEIDERIVGNWQQPGGGMDMFVDTPDMFYDESAMLNGTLERVLVSSDIPRPTGEPPYELYVSVDRGNSFQYHAQVRPVGPHWGFEFADLNITSNVRRYRFFYPEEFGVAVPTIRAYTDVFVPSGEFFPTVRPLNPPDPNIPPANIN